MRGSRGGAWLPHEVDTVFMLQDEDVVASGQWNDSFVFKSSRS